MIAKHSGMRLLWAGELPLDETFWRFAVGYGLLINLATTFLFYALWVNGATAPVLVAAYLAPLPYNFAMVVAVWRSANHYPGPRDRADLARVAIIVWMLVLTVT